MDKTRLLEWAKNNCKKFPVLERLGETNIHNISFIELPVKYGIYEGLYFCLNDNPIVSTLRESGYAVGIVKNYRTAQKLILECARKLRVKQKHRTKKYVGNIQ
ncbi:MAG: hypothetical protein FWD71_15150 [Oscillospiraceae bacterium]|nr:hypothetical protein [Oscillospiraceae bacterium]